MTLCVRYYARHWLLDYIGQMRLEKLRNGDVMVCCAHGDTNAYSLAKVVIEVVKASEEHRSGESGGS